MNTSIRYRLLRRLAVPLLAVGTLAAGLAGGVAWGAERSAPSSTIYACVTKATGAMREVTARTLCRPTETAQHWNVTGPVGPQGPPGRAGTQVSMVSKQDLYSLTGTTNDPFTLISMPITAGVTFHVTATLDVDPFATQSKAVQCFLEAGTPTSNFFLDSQFVTSAVRVMLQGQFAATSNGTVHVDCMTAKGAVFENQQIDVTGIPTS